MHVLVATDGSDDAIAAAQRALALLAPPATITLVAVAEQPGSVTAGFESGFAGGVASPAQIEADWSAVDDETSAILRRTVAALSTSAPIEQVVGVGSAGPELCRLARERAADVIVVGSRGHGAVRRALLGSVSTHVVNNAPCPVMVVRAGSDG